MYMYRIKGGKQIKGTVTISGNKNAALPCLAATLLTDEPVILENIPDVEDIRLMCALLEDLGSKIELIGHGRIRITSGKRQGKPDPLKVKAIRASILLVGPLLALQHEVELPPPGGDVIGVRRVDTHFHGFESLGASCKAQDGLLIFEAKELKGTEIFLDEASVTATENLLLCCALLEDRSVLFNCACEPHVQDLCRMLQLMGCTINGIGSNLICITGKKQLKGCTFSIGCDYMEVGTMIGLAVATGGEVSIKGITGKHIGSVLANGFSKLGVVFERKDDELFVPSSLCRKIPTGLDGGTNKIDDAPWPGFPSDLLSILTVCATQLDGSVLMHEKMFESRMFFVDWLIRMGADIVLCDPHRAVVKGPCKLQPTAMTSPDVRAGMALVIAAACSNGVSTIDNVYQIERGYEDIVGKLRQLGVDISREPCLFG